MLLLLFQLISIGGLFLLAVTSKNFPFQNRIAIQLRSSQHFAGDPQKTTLEIYNL